MDSVTLAYHYSRAGYLLHLLSVNYGQRHLKELTFARKCAEALDAKHSILELSSLQNLLSQSQSSLVSQAEVPEGHYAEDNMRATVVPNRNAILLSCAWGVAVAEGALLVGTAVHAGDHFIYPDCRPEFTKALTTALRFGTEGFSNPLLTISTPFITMSKADIVREGNDLKVPWTDTWSCYKGGDVHCGACGTCTERIEAFRLAGINDPTEYDPEGIAKYSQLLTEGRVK